MKFLYPFVLHISFSHPQLKDEQKVLRVKNTKNQPDRNFDKINDTGKSYKNCFQDEKYGKI